MSKHTPTPWRPGRPGTVVADVPSWNIKDEPGGREALEYYGGFLIAESIARGADVEFIVRACNAHDDALAVCRAIESGRVNLYGAADAVHDLARAAIAKATT